MIGLVCDDHRGAADAYRMVWMPNRPMGTAAEDEVLEDGVLEDEPIVGLAERFAELEDAPVEGAAAALREHAVAEGLPLPGARGPLDAFAWIADRLRRRELIADHGVYPVDVEWLAFHVPPRGRGSLTLKAGAETHGGLRLEVLGSGFGSGRAVQLDVTKEYGVRDRCMRIVRTLEANVRTYRAGGEDVDVVVDVLRVGAASIVPWETCPLCGVPAASLNPVKFERPWDAANLTHDDVGYKETHMVRLAVDDERSIGLGLEVAGVAGTASVSVRRSQNVGCEVVYEFAPRTHVVPFVRARDVALPFWALG
jgi:hypothetical protein